MEVQDSQRQVNNGPPEPLDDDTFERDLKEILEDAPNLNDLSSNVQSGSPQKMSASDYGGLAYNGDEDHEALGRMPRSFTVPPATSNVPLSTAHHNGDFVPKVTHPASSKLETIKNWSINTYKCTRQYLAERFGKGSKTVDLELEAHIEVLRDTQRKYANILRLARALTSHFYHVVQTQRQMSEAFMELSQKSPELQDEFTYNSETQRALVKNGETLLGALNFFTSSVNTLVHKTMEDTVVTIRQYEAARLEYDAYRNDVDSLQLGPQDSTTASRLDDARRRFDEHKDKFDRLRSDVAIKLKFLDENKVKVMHKQLLLFHNAVSAYFTGNESALDTTLKQFNIKLKAPNAEKPSWLEQ